MRKRFLLISTIIVLSAFTFAACGKKSPSSPESTNSETTTAEPTTEENTEKDTTEEEKPVATATSEESTKEQTKTTTCLLYTSSPVVVIADTDIFKKAPLRLTASGVSDLLGKYTALADWKITHLLTGEYICKEICDMEYQALDSLISSLDGLKTGEDVYKRQHQFQEPCI